MTRTTTNVDVAVVGASLAGCTVASLLGREGLRVALVEKHSDPQAYKRLCGHFVQPCATPVLRRLGLTEPIEAAGGVRNGADVWTRWGWIAPSPEPGAERTHGYSIRRIKLDPMIREMATATAGVDYLGGHTAAALTEDGEAVTGVVTRDRTGRELAIRARLVVGADGRNSAIGRLAGARERIRPNNRFCYMAYYEGIDRRDDDRGWFWALDPDVVIVVPNDDGLSLAAVFPHKDRLPAFKANREEAFEALVRSAPGAPDLSRARRVSRHVGFTDYPSVARPPSPRPGLALAGDAAMTCDPTWAIGCGWALQSGEWLADAVLPALNGEQPVARALRRYARRHRRALAGHARLLEDAALAKAPNPVERLMMSAATRDGATARRFERFVGRTIPVRSFLAPAALGRAAAINALAVFR